MKVLLRALLDSSRTPFVVPDALGHAQLLTTARHRHVVKEEKRAGLAKLPMLIEGDVVPLSAVAVESHATAPVNKQMNSRRLTGKSVGSTALGGSAHSGQSSPSLKGHTGSLDPCCWRSAGIALGVAITISASAHRHWSF